MNDAQQARQQHQQSASAAALADSLRLLPLAVEILSRTVEGKELEATKAAAAFNEELERVRKEIESLSGVDMTKEEQEQEYAETTARLASVQERFGKYSKMAQDIIAEGSSVNLQM